MKKVATALAFSTVLFASPAGANGPYKLQLLVDIYSVLVRCAPLDTKYAALGESVLSELEAAGFSGSKVAVAIDRDGGGAVDHARCAALIRPLVSAYLGKPE